MDKPFFARLFGRRRWNYTDVVGIVLFIEYLQKGQWIIASVVGVSALILSCIIEHKYFPEYGD